MEDSGFRSLPLLYSYTIFLVGTSNEGSQPLDAGRYIISLEYKFGKPSLGSSLSFGGCDDEL
jgi:hypothetical protein